ncbi:MAG TPA: hypothetical protein VNA57_10070 [Acidimicrobiales bacterium]|nr:hypothetical protein [Acidimicrobiales bacterium]
MSPLRKWLIAALVGLFAAVPACGDSDDSEEEAATTTSALRDRLEELSGAGVFVGGVAFTTNLVAIHFDRKDEGAPGMRVFVTDGVPDGNAEWFEGRASDNAFRFTSTSGKATIEGTIEQFETNGTVTLADGEKRNFFTRPAGDGAGVFEMTIGPDGSWNGTSLDGSKLNARQTGLFVEGDVVSTRGERYPFRHNDLTRRFGYAREGGTSGTYLTVVTRQATEIQGRGGDVRGGRPGPDVISLDLSADGEPTPGVYHGRVAGATDRLNFEIETKDGTRTLRSYVSDSEPEPAGDIEWFTGSLTGSTFDLTSKMPGGARITGTVADDGISGELTLPDGRARRYFAAPSGQGAGIYTVQVDADRHHTGTSAQGGRLDLDYEDGTVMGTLTDPDGKEYPMLGADLAHAYRFGEEYSKPDTYLAFVAPRGRYVYGRSGNVRGGSGSTNIIGLDKKC